jgi:hypothetical protein
MRLSTYFEDVLGVSVPLGAYLTLDHEEVCVLTSSSSAVAVVAAVKAAGVTNPIVTVIGAAIYVTSKALKAANEKSGGKGLRLRFNAALGIVDEVKKRGKGASPCPVALGFSPINSLNQGDLSDLQPLPFQEVDKELQDYLLSLPDVDEEPDLFD